MGPKKGENELVPARMGNKGLPSGVGKGAGPKKGADKSNPAVERSSLDIVKKAKSMPGSSYDPRMD